MRVEEEIAEIVRKHGWYAASIGDHQTPFLCTIGLMHTLDHPEFILFGRESDNAYALFSQLFGDIGPKELLPSRGPGRWSRIRRPL